MDRSSFILPWIVGILNAVEPIHDASPRYFLLIVAFY